MTDELKEFYKYAVSAGNLKLLDTLLADYNDFSEDDKSFILIATVINSKDIATLEYVIKLGMDLSYVDSEKFTALHYAAAGSCVDIVRYLLDKKFDIEAKTVFGATPLLIAANNTTDAEILDTLVQCGADIDATDNEKSTLVIEAAKNPVVEIMEYVLSLKPDLEAKDADGWTAIMNAARYNMNEEVIIALRNAGANFMIETQSGGNLLHLAAANPSTGVMRYLRTFFAATDTDNNGLTPLQLALLTSDNPEIVQLLLESQKEDVFFHACCNENPKILYSLLKSGYAVNLQSSDYSRPIFWVAKNNTNPEVLEVLISAGAILTAKDYANRTVLHYAAANESPAIYDWLLAHEELELDIEAKDDDDKTAGYYRSHPDEF